LTAPKRIQENITARAERRVLNWLCARLPMWLTPDRLTAIGFFGAVLVAAGFALSNFGRDWLLLAVAGFALNWFGDSLDGSIARYRNIERPNYGYFIDHSLDALANTLLVLGMGFSPYLRVDVALFGLVGYLLLSVHTFISARIFGIFQLSYLGGGPTEMRIALMAMTGAMYLAGPDQFVQWPVGRLPFTPFDLFVGALGVLLTGIFMVQTFRTGTQLFRKGE
jgi:archaetidylinositol phosphate synthase